MSNRQTATRATVVKITWDASKGLFKKCVGKKRGTDGKLRARIFWLGAVQHAALERAKIYADVWAELLDHELEGWTPEFEQAAEKRIRGAESWARLVAQAAASRLNDTIGIADDLRRMVNAAIPPVTDDPTVRPIMSIAPRLPAIETNGDTPAAVTTLHAALDEYVAAMKANRRRGRTSSPIQGLYQTLAPPKKSRCEIFRGYT
jgi:hypothetical protein